MAKWQSTKIPAVKMDKTVKSLIHKINALFVLHIFDNFHSSQNMSQIQNKFTK